MIAKKTIFSVTVEFLPGTDIIDAACALVEIARLTAAPAEAKFNGITITAGETYSPALVFRQYEWSIENAAKAKRAANTEPETAR